MHDLMHDLATSVAGIKAVILNSNDDNVNEKTLHVSFGFNLDASWRISSNLSRAKDLRTFLLPIQKLESGVEGTDNEICEVICSKFRRLRALDLHNLGIGKVSSSIKKLKYLRYLDACRNGSIEFLPAAITKLPKIIVLKLSSCSELKELPDCVTKLVELRCLDCEGCWNLSHMPRGLGKLTSLQTLTWFVLAKDKSLSKHIGGLEELGELNNLRGRIEIRNLRFVKDGETESALAKMENKQQLQSLTLSWNVEANDNGVYSDYGQRSSKCSGDDNTSASTVVNVELDKKILDSFKPHKKLQGLRVYEYGGEVFPCWLSSITYVVEIWIVNCKNLHRIPTLDQLPFLKDVWLSELTNLIHIDEREGTSNAGGSKFFPSLKQLRIWSCPNLNGWWKKENDNDDPDKAINTNIVELPNFPCLSTLDIRGCPKLTWLPKFLLSDGKLLFQDVDLARLQQVSPSGKVRFLNCLTSFSNVTEMWVNNCKGCRYFPPIDQIPSLEVLYFENVQDLEFIGMEANNDTSGGREAPNFFPSLKKLGFYSCPKLKGWCKVRYDDSDTTIIPTAAELPQFPCLSWLEISHCRQIIHLPSFPTVDDTLYLRGTSTEAFRVFREALVMKVSSSQLVQGRFSSELSPFTNLKELWLDGSEDLEYIGIESFALLKKVSLRFCLKLTRWFEKSDCVYDSTTTATATLPQFPALSSLSIRDCPNLNEMPLFPGLDGELHLKYASVKPFLQTINLTVAALTNLRQLILDKLNDLEYIGIEAFPFLMRVDIHRCPKLTSWWKKEKNDNESKTAAVTTMLEFPHFPALTELSIIGCPNLTEMPLFPFLEGRLRLENTSIQPFDKTLKMMTTLSIPLPLCKLCHLWIKFIKDVESLPAIQNLTSLQALSITFCPELRSLPEGIHLLKNLQSLEVRECPLLSERCQRGGVDWPNIAHIPEIFIDESKIQG